MGDARASAAADAADFRAKANGLSVAELKSALQRVGMGAEAERCNEKRELVQLYVQNRSAISGSSTGAAPGTPRRAPAQSPPRSNAAAHAQRRPGAYRPAPSSHSGGGIADLFVNMSWQNVLLIAVFAVYVYRSVTAGSPDGGYDDDADAFDADGSGSGGEAYIKGRVVEVGTLSEFKSILQYHKDATGIPVIVDFFSHSCGPCVMIAPAYKRLARKMRGKAAFIKVDVNRNYETSSACHIRAMPTFQFYLSGKKRAEFSGADERRLRQTAQNLASEAERRGTYVGMEVSTDGMREFYEEHDGGKVKDGSASKFAEKYRHKPAKLVRLLRKKYGKAVTLKLAEKGSPRNAEGNGKEDKSKDKGEAKTKTGAPQSSAAKEKEEGDEVVDEEDQESMFTPAAAVAKGSSPDNAEKVVVVGGGPAGLTAAIYAARAGLSPVLIAPAFGGQLLGKGVDVENYPGVVGTIATGRGIVELMRKQAHSFATRLVNEAVARADLDASPIRLVLNDSSVVYTHALVVATGADSRWLGAPGEHEFRGRGVSSCATCDGFLFRGQDVAVVGGGDTAMEDALVLARTSKSVTIVHRGWDFHKASHALSSQVLRHPKIRIMWGTTVQRFAGDAEQVRSIDVLVAEKDGAAPGEGELRTLRVGAVFVAIGHDPNTQMFKDQLDMNDAGYLFTQGKSTRTSRQGVFAAGDVADHVYRQAITSAGTGAMAALDAERWLSERGLGA
eukprot:g4265.t1